MIASVKFFETIGRFSNVGSDERSVWLCCAHEKRTRRTANETIGSSSREKFYD